jgi:hypothetical protein
VSQGILLATSRFEVSGDGVCVVAFGECLAVSTKCLFGMGKPESEVVGMFLEKVFYRVLYMSVAKSGRKLLACMVRGLDVSFHSKFFDIGRLLIRYTKN